jgi:O-antigen ligase
MSDAHTSSLGIWPLSGDSTLDTPERARDAPGRMLVLYGRLLGPLLVGYLLFDQAFAYIHLPGTPLYVGEMVLVVGCLGVLAATGYLRIVIRDEPILALLGAFFIWGFIRFLPGLRTYGIDAVRDFALVYYCLFAFFTVALIARSPDRLERWVTSFSRLAPWLLLWLPMGTGLVAVLAVHAPKVPFTTVSILAHKPGNVATAAMIILGSLWLLPSRRSTWSRAAWSILALLLMGLAGCQNRGGLLGATAGAAVGLVFMQDRLRLFLKAVAVIAAGLVIAAQLSLSVPASAAAGQSRAFSASQLLTNVLSIAGVKTSGNQAGTVAGRDQLWSLISHKQVTDRLLIRGEGFGPNLAADVGIKDAATGTDALRSPHNSHLDILARMGLVGLGLWIALWLGWYWRMAVGCMRLARRRLYLRRQVAILCLMVTTAILVSAFFDPQLEGAQVAAVMWTAFGVGVAVTSFRRWFEGDQISTSSAVGSPAPSDPEP